MEIAGVGIDIVDIERVRHARYPERIAEFVLTEEEREQCALSRDQVQFLASRLAAKEAVIKAYPGTLHYQDCAISTVDHKPTVTFVRAADQQYRVFVSIAHEFSYTVAHATLCR
jgi:phosphopantetheine--protein transferase-like protein